MSTHVDVSINGTGFQIETSKSLSGLASRLREQDLYASL